MLRHAGALRSALRYPLRVESHIRKPCARNRAVSALEFRITSGWVASLRCYSLHHATNICCRRRRDASTSTLNMLPFYALVGNHCVWESYGMSSVIGMRRTIFRRGWDKVDSVTGAGGGRKESSTMDEETRRSIRQGDDKSKESMQTVKLALAGNLLITMAKILAYWHSGSSAMSSEAMHSLVDSANQALLLVGLRSASMAPDKLHQYGYGKSVYFWSLLSALGTFWLGAGITMRHSIEELLHPTILLDKVGVEVWAVLGFSMVVDGYVLMRTLKGIAASRPEGVSLLNHVKKVRDPTTLAVLLEDGGACLGVVLAIAGCGMSQLFGDPVFDGLAGVSIAGLLGVMGMVLTEVNRRFLIGQAVDPDITEGIKKILMSRGSIENLHQVQSQWVGPHTFAFKAEVDFDGTYLAAKLRSRYQKEFSDLLQRSPTDKARDNDLEILLSFYTEDVMRAAEREVRAAETEIRERYPEAAFIELEPDSSTHASYALEHYKTPALRKAEEMTIKQTLAAILKESRDRMGKAKVKAGHLEPKTPQMRPTIGSTFTMEDRKMSPGPGDVRSVGPDEKRSTGR